MKPTIKQRIIEWFCDVFGHNNEYSHIYAGKKHYFCKRCGAHTGISLIVLEQAENVIAGYQKGLEESKLVNFNSQEDFTDKINKLILQGKNEGYYTKDISDKWHTFDELYYHRMILTYIILRNYPSLSWKSKQHHDGTIFDDSFIVGINTPKGQYSYHYDLEYWDLFDIRELDKAPVYDGHKPEDITRLLSLDI